MGALMSKLDSTLGFAPCSLAFSPNRKARVAFDDISWDGGRVDPRSTSIGLFGAVGLDVGISRRASFHAHLALEVNKPSYGDFEVGLARADGETGAEVDHDLRTAVLLVAGVTFGL